MCETSNYVPLEDLQSSMRLKIKDKDLVVAKMNVDQPDMAGDHFISALEKIEVDYVLSSKEKRKLHLFVKYNPDNETHRERIGPTQGSLKEIKFYETVMPALEELCDDYNATIPLRFPKCYYAKNDGVYDAVALEDVTKNGFKMMTNDNPQQGQDFKHCMLFVDALANYHAVTFALLKKKPQVVEEWQPFLEDRIFSQRGKDAFGDMVIKTFSNVLSIMEGDTEYKETVDGLRSVMGKLYDVTIELVKDPGPFKLINQGDCWSNNMQFRYDSNGNPMEVILYDMQLLRISALTVDLVYFFFTSTGPELRRNHLDQLLSSYYTTFTTALKSLGVDDWGFTVEDLKEDFRRRSALILIFIPTMLSVRLLPKSDFEDPGSENKPDIMDDLTESPKKVALIPAIATIFKSHLAAAFEEMKYSLNFYGLAL